VFDARGDVVTNAHVVGNATRFVVTLASGASHPATLVGGDAGVDLAVIRINGARPHPATFANIFMVIRPSRIQSDELVGVSSAFV
jgi:S1-C subfamily serine protease